MWAHLRDRCLDEYKFYRQEPIGPFIVDFVCREQRLAIELDGSQHGERQEADSKRDEWLRGQGYAVVRFWNNQVLFEMDGVKARILEALRSTEAP
jgi:very-short-patch-repair endonuclease